MHRGAVEGRLAPPLLPVSLFPFLFLEFSIVRSRSSIPIGNLEIFPRIRIIRAEKNEYKFAKGEN